MKKTLVALLAVFVFASQSHAQVSFRSTRVSSSPNGNLVIKPATEFGGEPFAKVWYAKNVNMGQFMGYMQQAGKDLGIKQNGLFMMAGPMLSRAVPMNQSGHDEMKGVLWYLVTKPESSFASVSFQKVADEKEFHKIVLQQSQRYGDMAKLTGGDDKYAVRVSFKNVSFSSVGTDPSKLSKGEKGTGVRLGVAISISSDGSSPNIKEISPDAMKQMQIDIPDQVTYYRFYDGVMYTSSAPALNEAKLPKLGDVKISRENSQQDIFADVDFTKIPKDLKETAWNTFRTQAGTYLQKYDNEADEEYSIRRAFGEGRMDLVKAAIFDIDHAKFAFRAASGDEPIQASLRIEARKGSELAGQLKDLNDQKGRLASLNNEQSPLLVSSTFTIPEWARKSLRSSFDAAKLKLSQSILDPSLQKSLADVFEPLQESIKDAKGDAAVALQGTMTDGIALVGAVRVNDAPRVADGLENLMAFRATVDATRGFDISTLSGITGLTNDAAATSSLKVISLSENAVRLPLGPEGTTIPVTLHITTVGTYVWFAIGNQDAKKHLQNSIQENINVPAGRRAAQPLLVRFELNKWLGADDADDDSTTFNRLPELALQQFERIMQGVLASAIRIGPKKKAAGKFTSYAAKALETGNGELELGVTSSDTHLNVDLTVDKGVAHIVMAQVIEAQNRMFSGMNFSIQQSTSKDGAKTIRLGPTPKLAK